MKKEQLDKFQIIDHIGSGYFGNVFLCYDPFLQKEIAVKVIKVTDPNKFVNAVKEGQTLDVCRHKHIVDVKDVCRVIQQTLLGLEHAHNNNILHRDIKPANILFGDFDEIKLSDFGLAINYHAEPSNIQGYRPHQPLEVIEGNPMDRVSDIYATGITFYRLLNNTNKLDFTFTTIDEWKKAVKRDKFPPRIFLPHIPEKIIKILKKSIHKTKGTRYQNCNDFRQAIDRLNFNIDWVQVDNDNWTGQSNGNNYQMIKVKKRIGWTIDFKKNGIRKTVNCCKNISDDLVESKFFEVIRKTTLH